MTDTARMMELAVKDGAHDVLGAIIERNAEEAERMFNLVMASKDAEIEMLRTELEAAREQLALVRERIDWLFGVES